MIESVLLALGALVVLVIATVAHYVFWTRRLTVPLDYASLERIPTPDGSAFELRRLPPLRRTDGPDGAVEPAPEKDALARSQLPVLLVHGIGIDHHNNDMLPDLSLARHLALAGRDVWLLTLRSGRSDLSRAERRLIRFEGMARYDLPLGIARVLEATGAPALDYVGFSMGGMLLYGSVGRTVDPSLLHKVVIIGSPAVIELPKLMLRLLGKVPAWLLPNLPLRWASRMGAFAADWFPHTPLHHMIYNPSNVDRGIAGRSLMTIQDMPGALSGDFLRWAVRGGPIDIDGKSVEERLEEQTTPVLFFAGAADRIASPASVRTAYEAWGRKQPSVDKTFVLLGTDTGAKANYGHGDLAIGRHARDEIFVPVARFLETRRA